MSTDTQKQPVLKKMFGTSLLLCALFVASFDAARFPNPLILGNGRFRSIMMKHQNAEFGEGVRDWFRNMRDKIPNQMKSMNPFDLNSSPITHFFKNNKESEQMMMQPMNFFLDLSTLKFDPSKDWGFHIGSWYIIRKSNDRDEWDNNWNNSFESASEMDTASRTRHNGVNDVVLPKTEVTSKSSKKLIEENETMDNTSVEVLTPLM